MQRGAERSRSRASRGLSPPMVFDLFEFVCVLRVRPRISSQQMKDDIKRFPSIQQAAWHESEEFSLVVLLCNNGSLLLRAEEQGKTPVVKQVSWFQNPAKSIRTVTLDPSGSWLVCCCLDGSLYVVPIIGFVKDNPSISSCYWSTEDITLIQTSDRRGLPSSVVWWHTVDDMHICIVGSELGEIAFIDLKQKTVVATVDVKESIISLELVQDKQQKATALLINTISSDTLQMQLEYKSILKASFEKMTSPSVASAMGYEMVGKVTVPVESVFLGTGNLQDKIRPIPYTTKSSTGLVHFSVQYARNQVFIGAHNKRSDILEVYDIDVENLLMFVYQLPLGTSEVLLTDRVIFTVTQQKEASETLLCVQSSQLAETSLSVPKTNQKTDSSIIQTFVLPAEERVIAMFHRLETVDGFVIKDASTLPDVSHKLISSLQTVDSVIVVTTSAVYHCRPRTSPEKLFFELAVNSADTSAADLLAITSGLDVNKLYQMAGDEALRKEKYEHALKLYHLSKCSFGERVAQFAKHGRVADILTYLRQALSKHSDAHTAERKQLSNLTLFCFIQQILENSGDVIAHQGLSEAFSQFINDNFDYDELVALEELSTYGLKDLMFDVAKARGLMPEALEMLAQNGQFHLSTELQAKLASRGFTDIVSKAANGAFIQCMNPQDAVVFLLAKPETILSHTKFLLHNLTSLNEESLLHIARVLDPSRPSFRSLAAKLKHPRQRTASGSSISSMISLESTVSLGKEECKLPELEDLIELFLCSLLVLNHIRDVKMDSLSRLTAVNCLCGKDVASENDSGRRREGSTNTLYTPVRLACGQQHTAIVSSSGDVYTWGRSQKGRLGHGDLIEEEGRSVPFRVEILHMHRIKVLSVACGIEHTLVLCNYGVYSWGSSEYGQLGQGDTQQQTRPVYITELSDKRCIAVSCGHYHSMALSVDHRVWSWGWGVHGQLGLGSIEDVLLPTHVTALDEYDITVLAAGYSHSAALTSQGQVVTFGGGLYGQLGLGTNVKQTLPQLVQALNNEKVYLICCGSFETMAVTEDQKLFKWGRSPHCFRLYMRHDFRAKRLQQISLPTNPVSHCLSPVQMDCSFPSQLKEVSCGNWHYLALTESGQLYSWGFNDHGQLGHGAKLDSQMTPRLVHKLSDKCVTSIGAGAEFSVALDAIGWVWVWGRTDSGQLGLDLGSTGAGKKEVALPCHLTSLPQMNRKVSTSSEYPIKPELIPGEDVDWNLPDLSVLGCKSVPYGREALTVTLQQLNAQYPAQPIIRHCIDIEDFLAAAVIYETLNDWPQIVCYGLKFLRTCLTTDVDKDRVLASVFEFLHYTTRKFMETREDDNKQIQRAVWLLQEILQFWCENCLASDSLEMFFSGYLDALSYPLSLILIRDPVIYAANQQSPQESKSSGGSRCVPQFSTEFFNKVVTHVVNVDIHKDNKEDHQYDSDLLQTLGMWTNLENEFHFDSTSGSAVEIGAALPCTEFQVAQKKLWQEILDNIKKDLERRPHIAVSVHTAMTIAAAAISQQRDWRPEREVVSDLQADVVLFSCNHHFPCIYFLEFVLPEFQQRMSELAFALKHTTKLLLRYFGKLEGFVPSSCPICVYNSIRIEQLEIVEQDKAVNSECLLAKPWEI